MEQSIYPAIARDVHFPCHSRFGQKIAGGRFARGEQQVGNGINANAIAFFGPWLLDVARSQACFDMTDRYSVLARRERAG
jgi:hypothetical protein